MNITKQINSKYDNWITFLIWGLIATLIHPISWLTLGDEFAYVKPVQDMLQTGEMHYSNWNSMTLVGLVYVGTAITKIIGYSVANLRLLMFLFGFGVLYYVTKLLRFSGTERWGKYVALMLICSSSIFTLSSLHFITDVPFLCLLMCGLYLLADIDSSNEKRTLILCSVVFSYAMLIRDVAILMPFSYVLVCVIEEYINKRVIRIPKLRYWLPFITCVLVYIFWRTWLEFWHGVPALQNLHLSRMLSMVLSPYLFVKTSIRNAIWTSVFIGWTFLPLSIILFRSVSRRIQVMSAIMFFVGVISCIVMYTMNTKSLGSISYMALGSMFPQDNALNSTQSQSVLSIVINSIVISSVPFALASFTVTASVFSKTLRTIISNVEPQNSKGGLPLSPRFKRIAMLAFVYMILYYFLLNMQWILDRYYLPIIVLIILIILPVIELKKLPTMLISSVTIICIKLVLTISYSHDVFADLRAREKAISYVSRKYSANSHQIDAGFSYGAMHNYDYYFTQKPGKNWWWVHDDKYLITKQRIDNRSIDTTICIGSWLPQFPTDTMFVAVRK